MGNFLNLAEVRYFFIAGKPKKFSRFFFSIGQSVEAARKEGLVNVHGLSDPEINVGQFGRRPIPPWGQRMLEGVEFVGDFPFKVVLQLLKVLIVAESDPGSPYVDEKPFGSFGQPQVLLPFRVQFAVFVLASYKLHYGQAKILNSQAA